MTAKSKTHVPKMCGGGVDDVVDHRRAPYGERSPKKGLISKAKDWLDGKSPDRARPDTSNGSYYHGRVPGHHVGGGASLLIPKPLVSKSEDSRSHPASSSHSDRNGSREADVYQTRAPPPGSYQDDDTGPSPKNLVMAVMGVKSAVNHFAKALISDMSKYPEELEHLKQLIRHEVKGEVDRTNHWKFLVQAFICRRLFEGFEIENGFFGIEDFDHMKMSPLISFADFSKYKDKAATISMLLAQDPPDVSFLGKFCFQKFKSISGNRALPIYQGEWNMVASERHPPKSDFYQSFLKVAVSVWLLHRLVHSFEQGWKMLGWETFPMGSKFQKANMESVVPGGYEEEGEDTDAGVNVVVGFLVIPGFQVSKSVVKCEVYLRNQSSHNHDGKIMEASSPVSSQTPGMASNDKTPAGHHTPASHHSPASYHTPASHHTPASYHTPAGHHTPASYHTPEKTPRGKSPGSFNGSSNYSGGASDEREASAFWTESGHKIKNEQARSPACKSGHLDRKGREPTSHYLSGPPSGSSKQPRPAGYVTRHTSLSRQREEENRRPRT